MPVQSADRLLPPADASRSYDVRHSRNAHDLYSGKICYRYHPHYDSAVQVIRYLRRGSAAVVIVRLLDGSQLAVPEWMLKPEVCEGLRAEAKPRVSVSALLEIRNLTRTQDSAVAEDSDVRAESATGGRDARQGESGGTAMQALLRRQRALGGAARSSAGELSQSLERSTGECCEEG